MAKRQTPREKTLSRIKDMSKETKEKFAEDAKAKATAPAKAVAADKAARKAAVTAVERVDHPACDIYKNESDVLKRLTSFFKEHSSRKKPFNVECFGAGDGDIHLHISYTK